MLLATIKQWVDRYRLLQQGDIILAAVSGGADSLALLHILAALRDEYGFTLAAAHINHMLRGAAADADEAFVKEHCCKWNIICYTEAVDVPAYVKSAGLSTEDAARRLRYASLEAIADRLGPQTKIATGHHMDDQAETVLLNMLRGAGSQGLRGMQPHNGRIIRPLLCVTKQALTAYCTAAGFIPRVDSTNFDTAYSRNRIRLVLLPQLEKNFNGGIRAALCRTASLAAAEHDFIACEAQRLQRGLLSKNHDGWQLAVGTLPAVHLAVRRELLRQVIALQRGGLQGIGFEHIERFDAFCCTAAVGSCCELPGIVAYKGYDAVALSIPGHRHVSRAPAGVQKLTIPGHTVLSWDGLSLTAGISAALPGGVIAGRAAASFEFAALVMPLTVRTRRPGDRFWPAGMPYEKKLKEFFIDLKIPRRLRDRIPLICDGHGRILWVAGYRASGLCRPVASGQILTITLNKIEQGDFQSD